MKDIKWEPIYIWPSMKCRIINLDKSQEFSNWSSGGKKPNVIVKFSIKEADVWAFQCANLTTLICTIADQRDIADTRWDIIKADINHVEVVDKHGRQTGALVLRGEGPERYFEMRG